MLRNDEDEQRWLDHAKRLRRRAYEYEMRALRHWQKRLGQQYRKEKEK